MYVTTTFTCGECGNEYDEDYDAEDCCDEEHGGAERLAERAAQREIETARRELEAAGQNRLFDSDEELRFERSVDNFIKTNQCLFEKPSTRR